MVKSSKPKTNQVEGGEWQATYDGAQFGRGATEAEAVAELEKLQSGAAIAAAADLGEKGSPPPGTIGNKETVISHVVGVAVDRVVVKKLPQPTEIDGTIHTHAAWRESKPEFQGYGASENEARVQLLTKEGEAPTKDLPA